jgi:hypothetical protein
MNHRRSGRSTTGPIAGLILYLAPWAVLPAVAEAPLLILGLTGGGYLTSAEGSPPAFFPEARLSALSSWRGLLPGGGIVSLNAASRLFGY